MVPEIRDRLTNELKGQRETYGSNPNRPKPGFRLAFLGKHHGPARRYTLCQIDDQPEAAIAMVDHTIDYALSVVMNGRPSAGPK
jgi:hypothetical protein